MTSTQFFYLAGSAFGEALGLCIFAGILTHSILQIFKKRNLNKKATLISFSTNTFLAIQIVIFGNFVGLEMMTKFLIVILVYYLILLSMSRDGKNLKASS